MEDYGVGSFFCFWKKYLNKMFQKLIKRKKAKKYFLKKYFLEISRIL
jgi:hypothetical protein